MRSATAPERGAAAPAPGAGRLRSRGLRAAIALAAALPILWLALEDGGYDPILRQGLAAAAWLALAAGLAAGVLPRGTPRGIALGAAGAAALLAWTGASLAWTESEERTLAELARLAGYLALPAAALLCLTRATFRPAAAGVAAVATGVAALAIASRLFPDAFPAADDVAAELGVADRLTYPFGYWNALGAWCAMAVATGLAWSAHARRVATRALALAGVPLAAVGVYLTYSRAGVIASAVAVLAVLALSRNRFTAGLHALAAGGATALVVLIVRDNPEIADATGGAGGPAVLAGLAVASLVCAAAAAAAAAGGTDELRLPRRFARAAWAAGAIGVATALLLASGPLETAWDEFRSEEEVAAGEDPASRLTATGGNRDELWASGISSFTTHPVGGTGPGTFEFWWSRDARDPEYVRDAHSVYVEHLAELGLPGLLALVALLGGLLLAAVRARARLASAEEVGASAAMTAAFAVFLVSAAVDWHWEAGAVAALALLSAGIAAAAGTAPTPDGRERLAGRAGAGAAAVTLAIAAAAVQLPGIVSTDRVRASQGAARDGDLERARDLAAGAVEAEPWGATPREQLALVLEAQRDYAAAAATIREAMEREPTNWRLPLVLARVQARDGRRAEAKATFLRFRRLRPLGGYYSPFGPIGQEIYTGEELRRIARTGSIRAGGEGTP